LFLLPFADNFHIRVIFSVQAIAPLLLRYISDRQAGYGRYSSVSLHGDGSGGPRKKVVVDFGSPNIGHEVATTHMRTTILGAFVANMYEAMGWDVVRTNYLGDWGKNFGLLEVGLSQYGGDGEITSAPNPLRYLGDIYNRIEDDFRPEKERMKILKEENKVEFLAAQSQGLCKRRDSVSKRMEDREEATIASWKKVRDISIGQFKKTYHRLGIEFAEYGGESQVCLRPETINEVEAAMKTRGISEEEDGSWVIDFEKHGEKLSKATLRDRLGLSSYLLRDLAEAFDRVDKQKADKVVYVVSADQDTHFRQLFKTIELMGRPDVREKLEHHPFAKVMPGGGSEFERARLLDDILDTCESYMGQAMATDPESYELPDGAVLLPGVLSPAALTVQELSVRRTRPYVLEPDHLVDPEGETGPALQLCYARLCREIESLGGEGGGDVEGLDFSVLCDEPWANVLRLLSRYPDVTAAAYRNMEAATTILPYVFRLVEELTDGLDGLGDEGGAGGSSAAAARYPAQAALLGCGRQVLENAMRILGVVPAAWQG
jgi:arginyl-tRNA synthetase